MRHPRIVVGQKCGDRTIVQYVGRSLWLTGMHLWRRDPQRDRRYHSLYFQVPAFPFLGALVFAVISLKPKGVR